MLLRDINADPATSEGWTYALAMYDERGGLQSAASLRLCSADRTLGNENRRWSVARLFEECKYAGSTAADGREPWHDPYVRVCV